MLWRPGAKLKMAPLIVLFLVIGLLGTSSDTNETLQKHEVKRSIDDLNTDQTLQSNIIQRIPLASSNGHSSNMVIELETWQLETKTDVKIFRVGPEVIVRRYYYPGLAFAIQMQTPATTSATTTVSVTPTSPISRTFQQETFFTTPINTVPGEGTTTAKTGTTSVDHSPASEPTNELTASATTTAENNHTKTSPGIATIPMSEGITTKHTPHSATTPEGKGTTKKTSPGSATIPNSEVTTEETPPNSATTPKSKGTTKTVTHDSATKLQREVTTKNVSPVSATTLKSEVITNNVATGSATTQKIEDTTKKAPPSGATTLTSKTTPKKSPQGSNTTLNIESTTKKSPGGTNTVVAETEKTQPTTKHSTTTTTTKRPTTTITTKRPTTTTTTKRPATKPTSKRPTTAAPIHTVIPVIVPTQAPVVRIVYLQFTLILDFQDDYNDPLSALFLALALWIEEELDKIFSKRYAKFKKSKVTKLQKGSVIVFSTLEFDNSTPENVNISTTLYDNWNSTAAIKADSVFVTTPSTTGAPNTVAHTVMALLLAPVFLVLRNLHVI